MTRGSKKRRIERLKSALIVLLSCSAVFLLVRTQAAIVSSEDSGTAYQAEAEGSSSTESPGATARPLRMAAAIQRGSEVVRYGVQYDQESTDSLYQQSYSLLVEALSSASQPRAVGETEFQQALSTAPGLYFDWQGEIPVAVFDRKRALGRAPPHPAGRRGPLHGDPLPGGYRHLQPPGAPPHLRAPV